MRGTLAERLAAKTDRTSECWNWTGKTLWNGYGTIKHRGREVYVHRTAFELLRGPIPPGIFVCHRCDNRVCVRPDHLFLGTCQDNLSDMRAKGRQAVGEMCNHKLTTEQVMAIKQRLLSGAKQAGVALAFGVNPSTISRINTRARWRHLKESVVA